MSQTWKENEKELPDPKPRKSYDAIRKGFSSGSFFTSANSIIDHDDGCVETIDSKDFENKYWNFAAGYSRTEIKENGEITYGADIIMGNYRERSLDHSISNKFQLFSIYPYVRYKQIWFGVGGGLYIGPNYWAEPDRDINGSTITTSTVESIIYPSLYGRIGPEKIFFVDGGLANAFPSPFPGMRYEMAIGSGFGLPQGNRFRYGTSPFGNFFQAEILPHQSFLFSGSYVWQQSHLLDKRNRQFLFGLQYRFNHR